MAIDYYKMFADLAQRHSDLVKQTKIIEIELAKLTQTLESTFNMLTPREQKRAAKILEKTEVPKGGLKEGVLMALKARNSEWLTPPEIRDYLKTIGFDFGSSNVSGLASIGTTLKRMPPDEVETKSVGNGQTAYRLRGYQGLDVGEAVLTFLRDTQNLPEAARREKKKAAIYG